MSVTIRTEKERKWDKKVRKEFGDEAVDKVRKMMEEDYEKYHDTFCYVNVPDTTYGT